MSLFNFGDIQFNKVSSPGPLSVLDNTPFGTSTFRYPIDIGNYDKGHYMVFYVREQNKTSYPSPYGTANESSIDSFSLSSSAFQNIGLPTNSSTQYGSDLLKSVNSSLTQLNAATGGNLSGITDAISGVTSSIVGGINDLFGSAGTQILGNLGATQSFIDGSIKRITNSSFIKTTRLTKEAIALYMPDTLMYTQQQNYSDVSLSQELGGQAIAAYRTTNDAGLMKAAADVLVGVGSEYAKKIAGSGSVQTVLAAAGLAQNPMLELVYTSPSFRTFQFDFIFYPRDEKESMQVQEIIDRFRFHQCPETTSYKNLLIPPSQFDIRFYYGGRQNPNIPQIATCVLTGIDINYAPNGFSAYEIPGESAPSLGRTGMPVAINMTLQFKEVTILTKDDFGREKSSTNISETVNSIVGGQAQTWTNN